MNQYFINHARIKKIFYIIILSVLFGYIILKNVRTYLQVNDNLKVRTRYTIMCVIFVYLRSNKLHLFLRLAFSYSFYFCRTPDIVAMSLVMLCCWARCAPLNISKIGFFSSMVEQKFNIFLEKSIQMEANKGQSLYCHE